MSQASNATERRRMSTRFARIAACTSLAWLAAACITTEGGTGDSRAGAVYTRSTPEKIEGNPPLVRRDLWIPCGTLRCAAWLYLPPSASSADPAPVVVMAHGFGMTRAAFLPDVAAAFARKGLAVLLFDYRHFGDSEGEPREQLDIGMQLADWRSALTAARGESTIDPERIALFGTSLSGGHVLVTAANDGDVRAVVAQTPFVGDAGEPAPLGFRLRAGLAIASDYVRQAIGLGPQYVTVIGPPGAFAAQADAVTYEAFEKLELAEDAWKNRVPARSLLEIGSYNPRVRAAEVQAPLLVIATRNDELIPLDSVSAVADVAPNAELLLVDGTHFEVYGPPLRDTLIQAQVEFLRRHLLSDKK
jgi:uncharacterized protein